ncbi:MAG: stage II sporulation protein D [Oscillospiraceae bacterium]
MLKQSVGLTAVLGVLLFLLPLLWFPAAAAVEDEEGPVGEQEGPAASVDGARTLRVEIDGEVEELRLDDYLVGVVAAEMPAGFEPEALKAQTVAARTYTLYQLAHGSSGKHESGADLCDQPSCCQAYIREETARSNWGALAEENWQKLRAAEEETDGVAILYGGEPILAAFHSSSADGTEDAAAAWSASVPYLQRVESPESAEDVPNYVTTVSFTEEEFRNAILAVWPEAQLTGDASGWVKDIVRDASGYVSTLTVGGVTLRGVELRRALGLRSACFSVTAADGLLTFSTQGYGHGVGMSQYGANALAKQGKSWQEILQWYYTGVTLETYTG